MRRSGSDGFRETFDRAFPLAERLATRITGDPAAGRDIAAEALTRLYVRWTTMARVGHVDAWVLRVATNLAISNIRARNRREPQVVLEHPSPDDAVILRLALAEALGHLPRRQREVVVLRYLSDLSEADVAAALGVTVGSVKTHLHRGLGALRDRLGADDENDVEVRLVRA